MMMPPPSAGKKSGGAAPDMRGALLGQIQKGAKLKKVTTVDKSTPLGAGKIAGESTSAQSSPMRSAGGAPRGMPVSNKTSPDSSSSSPVSSSSSRQGGFASLTDELQYKMTLKKNKQSPIKESKNITETKEVSVYAQSDQLDDDD
jgi:hypothetical protein